MLLTADIYSTVDRRSRERSTFFCKLLGNKNGKFGRFRPRRWDGTYYITHAHFDGNLLKWLVDISWS